MTVSVPFLSITIPLASLGVQKRYITVHKRPIDFNGLKRSGVGLGTKSLFTVATFIIFRNFRQAELSIGVQIVVFPQALTLLLANT